MGKLHQTHQKMDLGVENWIFFAKNTIFSHFIYIFYSKSVHRIVPVSTFVVFLLLTTLEWKSLIFATRTFHELTQGLFEMRNITFYKIV